jgi:hypothetical protein
MAEGERKKGLTPTLTLNLTPNPNPELEPLFPPLPSLKIQNTLYLSSLFGPLALSCPYYARQDRALILIDKTASGSLIYCRRTSCSTKRAGAVCFNRPPLLQV